MKKHTAIFVLIMLMSGAFAFAQQAPKAFKYQAVARDANNQPYANTNLRLRIGVVNAANLISYLETHNVTTSDLGVFNLNVGQGTVLSGNFSNVNWGAEALFLSIELSLNDGGTYTSMGLSPLLSVPYALYAGQAAALDGNVADNSPTNELQQLTKTGNVISLSQGGGSVTDEVNDADASPTNEIQTLSISGTVLSLSNGGGSVTLPVGGGDGDNWGTQTVQTTTLLSGNGTPATPLSIADNAINSAKIQNGSIQAADIAPGVIPSYTAGAGISINGNQITNTGDADNNPANELQSLALSGNQLSISNGNSVTLPTGGTTYTAGSGINITGNVISATDNSPVNEIQTLSLSGTVLSLSSGGGSVTLPVGGGGGDNWGTQTVETTILLSGNGTAFNPISIADNAINSAKIQDGSIQAADIAPGVIPNYTSGSGISIIGNQITNTGDADNNPANELQAISLSGNTLSLSNGGGSVALPPNTDNQTLALSGNQLSITNGNSVTLPTGATYTAGNGISITGNQITNTGDADNNPTNELQTISLSGNTLSLSNGGGTVALPPNTDTQTLALSGNQLSITNGNSVTLPTGTTYTAGSGISITGNAISATDNSATNELQTISLSGNNLSLSNGGGTVTLPATGSSYWQSFGGNDIINNINNGTVFIGPATYESLFAQGSNNYSTFVSQNGGTGKAISAHASSGTAIELNGLVALRATGTGSSPAGTFNNNSGDGIALQVNGGLGIFGGFENYNGTVSKADAISNFKFAGGLSPGSNNFYDLGSSDRRWKVIYATNGTINTSDARQKQAIQPIGYGLAQVNAMKPVSFEWIDHPEQGRKLGFLAQDLQTVVPEVVSETEWITDGKGHLTPKKAESLGVYYSDLIPVLTKAIQEQQEQIAGQAVEINALKAAIEAQRQDMARILAKLEAGQR